MLARVFLAALVGCGDGVPGGNPCESPCQSPVADASAPLDGPAASLTLTVAGSDTVITGHSVTLDVTIVRSNGSYPVIVSAAQLSDGLAASPLTIGGDQTTGKLIITAAADAAQGKVTLALTALLRIGYSCASNGPCVAVSAT